ncbi:glycoside hydrolase family 25 protein [Chiua virens]|nr:glycoside hydrolase family 25 protein [Chiua virens]
MKYLASLALALAVARATPVKRSDPLGIDVSDYQTDIDWTTVVDNGIQFVYIKATEGTDYISPEFSSQYTGATDAGLIRGAYHFAHPDESTGATQADYFLANGGATLLYVMLLSNFLLGGWSADGITLPGALDIEYNPDGAECYGLTASEMVSWVQDFSDTYEATTGRYPVIYTTTDWWTTCTGNSAALGANNPLWIADYASTLGTLPAGWEYTSFWQYDDSGPNPGDADLWNGDYTGLQSMAYGYTV